jgi:acyl dehydratase
VSATPTILHAPAGLTGAVGTHLGHSDWHLVPQGRIDQFADCTGDHQWIHVDPLRAATGPFGGAIAHGFLTLSMIPMLAWEVFRIDGASMEINYGLERVRFPAPVPAGSMVRAGVEVLSYVTADTSDRLTTRVSVECTAVQKPVCIADLVTLVIRVEGHRDSSRPGAGASAPTGPL